MARGSSRPTPQEEQLLQPVQQHCPACGQRMWCDYDNHRTVATLSGLVRLKLKIRRCRNVACARHHRPYRPEAEAAIALPQHEFGLDVIALIGALRYRAHQSVPEIHRSLQARGLGLCERTVTNL